MTFPYTIGVPNPPNNPSVDVGSMQTNTNTISLWVAVDHVRFNNTTAGLHNQVTFSMNQAITGVGDGVSRLFANIQNGQSWPYWINALGTPIQMLSGNPSPATKGYTYLPGGIIIQWGGGTVAASGTATAFTFGIPFPNNLFAITIGSRTGEGNSPGENNQFIKEGTQNKDGFSIVNSSSSSSRAIYYMAIGN